jgi:SnoaL-like domain
MSDVVETVAQYIAAWNETDPAARRAAVERVFAPDAVYTDPIAGAAGHEQISSLIEAVQNQFPGLVFTLGSEPDAHHDIARFTWNLGPAGESPLIVGFDVVVLTPEGGIGRVHGFLDKVPAGA